MDKKTILAIALSFLVVLGYHYFFAKQEPAQQLPTAAEQAKAGTGSAQGTQSAPAVPAAVKFPKEEIKQALPAKTSWLTPLFTPPFSTPAGESLPLSSSRIITGPLTRTRA